jgi:hypothetical protein
MMSQAAIVTTKKKYTFILQYQTLNRMVIDRIGAQNLPDRRKATNYLRQKRDKD